MPNPEVVYIQQPAGTDAAAMDAECLSFDEWKEAWGEYRELRDRGFDDRRARMFTNLRALELRCQNALGWHCDCVLQDQSCPACRGEARGQFGDSIPYEF